MRILGGGLGHAVFRTLPMREKARPEGQAQPLAWGTTTSVQGMEGRDPQLGGGLKTCKSTSLEMESALRPPPSPVGTQRRRAKMALAALWPLLSGLRWPLRGHRCCQRTGRR